MIKQPNDKRLSNDDFDALPDGTEIIVTWHGGNGPLRCTLTVSEDGRRCIFGKYGEYIGTPDPLLDHITLADRGDQ
ncbi:hypothetical protein ACQE3D_10875 [Methylomonas sp. MS20]|uniref:hypothetical protein n=1 Tax=unclassified Methylomonas TaxID=2608980 RepID=UPI0028A4D1FA|nr:hypothetical protein [Methylomonas sp. MV1]MDT4328499.1 hypothetical protein [Methylomonas sp. MV1]